MSDTMQSLMASDLSELFDRDMPAECKVGAKTYTVLVDDLLSDEAEGYGGPEAIDMQRVHFKASDRDNIEIGTKLGVRPKAATGQSVKPWKSKIVLSSILSADGNELIATVRGA